MLLVFVKLKYVLQGKKWWGDHWLWGEQSQGGGKGMEEETETHLKPAPLLSPGFLVSSAVLNSNLQTHLMKDFGWFFLEGMDCEVAFSWDSGLRAQNRNDYSVRNPLSRITCFFCPLLIILRSLCIMVVCFCTCSFRDNTFLMGGCTLHSSVIQVT